MDRRDSTIELDATPTLVAGLAVLAVAAVGGGALVGAADGAQVSYYLGDSDWTFQTNCDTCTGVYFAPTGDAPDDLARNAAAGSAFGMGIGGPLGALAGAGVGAA